MTFFLQKALSFGAERIISWADVLDRINVYPVPDGDTGRNLVYSLSPLRGLGWSPEELTQKLLLSARGNSGNIASRFLAGLVPCPGLRDFPAFCAQSRDLAYQAVAGPQPGTMLTVFDVLAESLAGLDALEGDWPREILPCLEEAVRATPSFRPELEQAGVVDSGALGMLVFLDALFSGLTGRESISLTLIDRFGDWLDLGQPAPVSGENGSCLDVVVRLSSKNGPGLAGIQALGESVVAIEEGDLLKIHLHAMDQDLALSRLGQVGTILRVSADDLDAQSRAFSRPKKKGALHLMSDAAGAVTREEASELGITLLDSYVQIEDLSLPETYVEPDRLFEAMRRGRAVSTAQASVMERRHHLAKALRLHDRVLYLCVGSVFTGNYHTAMEWKAEADLHDGLEVVDTGSASGRLGLAVLAAARFSQEENDPNRVADFARGAVSSCREILFLDRLEFLARGGRLSRPGAFFGDLLRMKPAVSPQPRGAEKVAVHRRKEDQIAYALRSLAEDIPSDDPAWIMVEYSDNRDWVEKHVVRPIQKQHPSARVFPHPVSITSAVHMGPGTWGVAWLESSAWKRTKNG